MEVFEAIAQPKRREILRLLAREELSAGTVAAHFDVTQPAVSQHLRVLKDAGLVTERREGTRRLYSVRPEGLADLHDFLAEVLPMGLRRLKRAAEAEARDGRPPKRAAEAEARGGRPPKRATETEARDGRPPKRATGAQAKERRRGR